MVALPPHERNSDHANEYRRLIREYEDGVHELHQIRNNYMAAALIFAVAAESFDKSKEEYIKNGITFQELTDIETSVGNNIAKVGKAHLEFKISSGKINVTIRLIRLL